MEVGAWSRPFRDRQEGGQAKDEWFACEGGGREGGRGGALVSGLSIPVGRETTPCRAAGVEERWGTQAGRGRFGDTFGHSGGGTSEPSEIQVGNLGGRISSWR